MALMEFAYCAFNLLGRYFLSISVQSCAFVFINNFSDLKFLAWFFKLNSFLRFELLNDISVVDLLGKRKRFKLVYNFSSVFYAKRLMLGFFVKEGVLVESLRRTFLASNWLEREAWDMYGVFFFNHFDLRRILTDYGFVGYPLRKDFPLTGFVELRYDESKGEITYEPVELSQEFRFFNFSSGWE
jgi:NADH:ubiquinone oxidoreductase subunit C